MALLRVYPDRVVVRLTQVEKALGVRRSDVTVQRDDIRSATITTDPWVWVRGRRSRGVGVPGMLTVGAWQHNAGTDFLLTRPGRDAVVLDLAAGEFSRVIVSTAHAAAFVDALRVAEA